MTRLPAWRRAAALALSAALGAGCLGEPEIEDRWTRLDLHPETIQPGQPLTPGTVCSVTVRTSITYRDIVTGFAVTELRASSTVTPASVQIGRSADRLLMAQSLDHLLRNSVSTGRATRAITGWDHLIQQVDFAFRAGVPSTVDSAGVSQGPAVGLFLVTYLASGQEVERADGTDTLIVTPFVSTDMEILPMGFALAVNGYPAP